MFATYLVVHLSIGELIEIFTSSIHLALVNGPIDRRVPWIHVKLLVLTEEHCTTIHCWQVIRSAARGKRHCGWRENLVEPERLS